MKAVLPAGTGALSLCMWLFFFATAHSQPVQSPYTAYGIGERLDYTLPHHLGMGKVGVALRQDEHINGIQPALLAQNHLTYLQLGVAGETRQIRGQNSTRNYSGVKLGALTLAFPLKINVWGIRMGLAPYSEVAYRIRLGDVKHNNEQITTEHTLTGQGGLNRLHLAQGVRLLNGVYVGVELGYYFGFIEKSDFVTVNSHDPAKIGATYTTKENYTGLDYAASICLSQTLTPKQQLSFGLVFQPSTNLQHTLNTTISHNLTEKTAAVQDSTLTINTDQSTYQLPGTWRIGVGYSVTKKFMLGLDIQRHTQTTANNAQSSWRVGLGTSYTPQAGSLNYFARLPYRLGLSWEKLPYPLTPQLQDISAYIGTSLRLQRYNKIDIGLRAGSRSTQTQHAFREHYLQIHISTTLANKWFLREAYE